MASEKSTTPSGSDPPYADWIQLARPAASGGVSLTHYRTGPAELDHVLIEDIHISICRASMALEYREEGGPWQTRAARVGDISFVPPQRSISARWPRAADSLNLHIKPGWLEQPHSLLASHSVLFLHDKLALALIEDIYRDNLLDAPWGPIYGETLALAALCRVGALGFEEECRGRAPVDSRAMIQAVDYIRSHLDEELSLEELTRAINWTSALPAFVRAFRRHHGLPPHRYIIESRLEHARVLLSNTRKNITDVAFSCGFSSLSHFSGAFKKRWGITPNELKRQAQ